MAMLNRFKVPINYLLTVFVRFISSVFIVCIIAIDFRTIQRIA